MNAIYISTNLQRECEEGGPTLNALSSEVSSIMAPTATHPCASEMHLLFNTDAYCLLNPPTPASPWNLSYTSLGRKEAAKGSQEIAILSRAPFLGL